MIIIFESIICSSDKIFCSRLHLISFEFFNDMFLFVNISIIERYLFPNFIKFMFVTSSVSLFIIFLIEFSSKSLLSFFPIRLFTSSSMMFIPVYTINKLTTTPPIVSMYFRILIFSCNSDSSITNKTKVFDNMSILLSFDDDIKIDDEYSFPFFIKYLDIIYFIIIVIILIIHTHIWGFMLSVKRVFFNTIIPTNIIIKPMAREKMFSIFPCPYG